MVFHAEDLTKRYGDNVLFEDLSFDVKRGQRLGIMGPNGCGKTTLLRILLGDEEPTAGEVQRGHLVFPGYLDQHLKLLPEHEPVLRAVWPEPDPSLTEQKMRNLLGSFGLHGETVEQPVRELSGGERSRAALAKLTVAGANVLVLDEPTNHLDIWACDSLEEALKAFDGSAIVVSHDRYFLNRVVDVLIVFHDGRAEVVYGNYDTYELLRRSREQVEKSDGQPVSREAKPSAAERGADEGEAQAEVPLPQGAGPGGGHRGHRGDDHPTGDGAAGRGPVQGPAAAEADDGRPGGGEGPAAAAIRALGGGGRIKRVIPPGGRAMSEDPTPTDPTRRRRTRPRTATRPDRSPARRAVGPGRGTGAGGPLALGEV